MKQCSTLSSPFFEANNCKETNIEVTVRQALPLCGCYVVLGGGGSFRYCVPVSYDSLFGQVPYQVCVTLLLDVPVRYYFYCYFYI